MKPSAAMGPTSLSSPGLDPQFSMMESEPRCHKEGQYLHSAEEKNNPTLPLPGIEGTAQLSRSGGTRLDASKNQSIFTVHGDPARFLHPPQASPAHGYLTRDTSSTTVKSLWRPKSPLWY